MKSTEYRNKLVECGLKVTPQRMAILQAIIKLDNHPTADQIIELIRKNNPNISTATVYKVLDTFAACGLIKRVTTATGIMRYDAHLDSHHHLYYADSDKIEDYRDEELSRLLETYFKQKNIPGFEIEDLKLQIIGKHTDN